MSAFDDYKAEERKEMEPGDYRVVIVEAEATTSKSSGLPMIVVTVQPSGSDMHIKNYLVKNKHFNKNATALFDSFGIERGNFLLASWIGAMGAARLVEDEDGYMRVKWFLNQRKQEKLPPWEGEKPERQEVNSDFSELSQGSDDLPF